MTKSNRKNNKNKDLKTSKNEYFDPDSLKENKDAEDYLKGLAALTTVFGVGAAGLAFTPTKVHAAESTVDVKSQVVGSVSQAKDINSAASNTEAKESDKESLRSSISDARSEANSNSDVRSESNSTSENTSTKGSTSESGSTKGNTSESNSTINSNSNSTKKSTSLTSNSEKHSENTSMSGSNASQSAIKSNLNSNLNSNLESNLKSDNGSEITSYIKSSSGSLANSLSEATPALDDQAAIARAAFGTSLRAVVNSSVDQGTIVSTWEQFTNAINKRDKVININNDLYLENIFSIDYDVTINAHGHKLYANNSIVNLNGSFAGQNVTVENANIYGTSVGTFNLLGKDGNVNLTLDNIKFTGGTLVSSDYSNSSYHEFNLTFTGDNTVTAGEYDDTVTKQTPSYCRVYGATTQLDVNNGVKVADGARLTMKANDSVDYNIMEKGTKYSHSFIVGEGAKVTMTGTKVGNVIQDQYGSKDAWNNIVNFGEGAKVTMTAPTVNVLMNNGGSAPDLGLSNSPHDSTFTINPSATVNLTTTKKGSSNGQGNIVITGNNGYYSGNGTVTSGDTSLNHTATINIDQDANVTMLAAEKSSNIFSNALITNVNINDPDSVVLMNHGGQAYTTIGNGSINVSTNNAKVTTTNINNDSISSSVLDSNVTKYQSNGKVDPGDTTADNTNVLKSIADSKITNVTYIGKTKTEASELASTSLKNSEDQSANQSESVVQSTNASITDSENASTSLQNSEAASANKSTSLADSVNASVKTSELNSTSAAQSVAGSQSTSAANSALNSRSVAESTAASENTSANASESVNDSGLQSQSIVDSGSQSISGSTSITSEGSLSGSTSVADSVDKLLPALDIVLTHNAYIYQNDGITTLKENGKNIVLKFGKTIHAMNNGQIFTFNGKKFYRIGDNQYVKVSNTISYYYLVQNSFLYNKHGKTIKRNGKRILVRKGVRFEANKVKVVKINGKKFYKVGKSTYIKFREYLH